VPSGWFVGPGRHARPLAQAKPRERPHRGVAGSPRRQLCRRGWRPLLRHCGSRSGFPRDAGQTRISIAGGSSRPQVTECGLRTARYPGRTRTTGRARRNVPAIRGLLVDRRAPAADRTASSPSSLLRRFTSARPTRASAQGSTAPGRKAPQDTAALGRRHAFDVSRDSGGKRRTRGLASARATTSPRYPGISRRAISSRGRPGQNMRSSGAATWRHHAPEPPPRAPRAAPATPPRASAAQCAGAPSRPTPSSRGCHVATRSSLRIVTGRAG
jgi:hypothetical protein